jgi:hypothetical protein
VNVVIDLKSKCSEAIIVQNHSALAPGVHANHYQSGRLITALLTALVKWGFIGGLLGRLGIAWRLTDDATPDVNRFKYGREEESSAPLF